MSVVSSFFQVRVVELSVLRVHSSVTVLPIFSITTRGFVIEIAGLKIAFDDVIVQRCRLHKYAFGIEALMIYDSI